MDQSASLDELKDFGTLLTEPTRLSQLPRAFECGHVVAEIMNQLTSGKKRSILLSGPGGVGKTAMVYELGHLLAQAGWHLLEVTSADFLNGTLWLGEWQTRLKKLIELTKQPQPFVLYLPDFDTLGSVGRASNSSDNVADALTPSLARGELAVISETTGQANRQQKASELPLRRLFQTISVGPADSEKTRRIMARIAEDAGVRAGGPVLDQVLELTESYSLPSELPGRAIELLRRSLEGLKGAERELTATEVLASLQAATGMPTALLDDRIQLSRDQVQSFFEARVMGQPEAVQAAVDFVMMIKAGLSDPQKPLGVLMFVGPTGVGKTEMARALAEYCFGDSSRMLRLDMSEYATWEAPAKLLGAYRQEGVLTAGIRKQPFSIILLDEIEKAHPAVFDLCLQLFDAGRMTDGAGETADFRRSLIILTSNIGSKISQQPAIGFEKSAEASDIDANLRRFAKREMARFFRPEFLNRLDRVVHFSPLNQETAENIAHRELANILQRSGIRRRQLTVEISPAVIPQLLREGYSQVFGARPLKRAIERAILLPLARMIAAGSAPGGSVIRIGLRGGVIKPRLVKVEEQPESQRFATPEPSPSLPFERIEQLLARLEGFRARAEAIATTKQARMLEASEQLADGQKGAWQQTNDAIYRLDGIFSAYQQFSKSLGQLQATLRRRDLTPSFLAKLPEIVEELDFEGRYLDQVFEHASTEKLQDAVVTLTRIEGRSGDLDGVRRLAEMYRRFAGSRQLAVQVLNDQQRERPPIDTITLLIEGAGAHLLLGSETGRHILLQGREGNAKRETIQVQVLAVPADSATPERHEFGSEVRRLRGEGERLARRKVEVKLYHTPTLIAIRAWLDCDPERAVNTLMPWLVSQIRAAAAGDDSAATEEAVIRRYRLGPSELVRDARTGLRWGRLDRVLDGGLHRFLLR